MDVLVHLGLCAETAPGQFTCTPLGALLQTDAPQSLRHIAMLIGGEWFGPTWPCLAQSVCTGTSAFESVFGTNAYSYYQQHPAILAVFQQAMSDLSTQEGLAIREAYDFAGCRTVVDVGGGRGGLLAILLQAFPSLNGILVDVPASWRMPKRCSTRSPCGGGVSSWVGIFWRQCRREETCTSSRTPLWLPAAAETWRSASCCRVYSQK